MTRYVYECLQFDQQTGTCIQAGFVPRNDIPDLTPAQVGMLLAAVAVLFAVSWGYKHLGRTIRS
ncbi:hypothetical protein [uncultured Stenotrophomonas sp.]|uniref:hypothetical protein n=1 Tax=uncultured Stenotrophomonas sp. TaxID=165438 RepID=UPI0028D72DDA|nr:hypothetical protein [uncultured Stenotrophomonas sp.]